MERARVGVAQQPCDLGHGHLLIQIRSGQPAAQASTSSANDVPSARSLRCIVRVLMPNMRAVPDSEQSPLARAGYAAARTSTAVPLAADSCASALHLLLKDRAVALVRVRQRLLVNGHLPGNSFAEAAIPRLAAAHGRPDGRAKLRRS
jgi:hypothetical protein